MLENSSERVVAIKQDVPNPLVFIIILNWNGYVVTRACLLSLQKLTYSNYRLIVVDNGSRDDSAERLSAEFPQANIFKAGRNLGFTGGNNLGIKLAMDEGADYVLLLNNDTVVDELFLSELVRAGEQSSAVGILNPKIYYFDAPTKLWYAGGSFSPWRGIAKHYGQRKEDKGQFNQVKEVSFATGCAFLIKAKIVRKIGMLDDVFFYTCEDTDWTIRAIEAGYKALYVPSSKIWHKESFDVKQNEGKSFRDYYNVRNTMLIGRKHLHFYHVPSFLVSLFILLSKRLCVALIRRDADRLKAVLRGVRSGLSDPLSLA